MGIEEEGLLGLHLLFFPVLLQIYRLKLRFLLQDNFTGSVNDVIGKNFTAKNIDQALVALLFDNTDLIIEILVSFSLGNLSLEHRHL